MKTIKGGGNIINFPADKKILGVKDLLTSILNDVEDIEDVILLIKRKDGSVSPALTDQSGFHAIAMAELLKQNIMDLARQ